MLQSQSFETCILGRVLNRAIKDKHNPRECKNGVQEALKWNIYEKCCIHAAFIEAKRP